MSDYKPEVIETYWQNYWKKHRTFRVEMDPAKPKYYVLDMFPYPSGSGLHVGHPEGYTATDIVARYKRMQGFNVLHPMGWDAFGLPAERAAVREQEHPAKLTERFISNFKRQIQRLGFSYDWDREINTTDPKYYRWTQWIFKKLYERGLAYQAEVPVNWCPAQGTVLANEEVVDGEYVETGDPVYRRNMRQWLLKIPEYAQRLLDDLEDLDWPESVKEMQRYWIGRSEGAELEFQIVGHDESLRVYTTRPDTLFGCTYMVLAPEHPLVDKITADDAKEAVDAYVKEAATKSDLERTELEKDKSGVFTGAYVENPANGEEIPIYISDYVLITYGTGAIMAVPAHDQRDWEFAKKYDIPVIEVVDGGNVEKEAWEGDGKLVNSGFLNGMEVHKAKKKMTDWLEDNEIGEARVNYRLRDWLFSRQRYWGEPFPVLHDEEGNTKLVADEDLPVTLPWLEEFKPTEDGEPPLARAEHWVKITDPETGKPAFRETNTMPQWAGSCWYYLRFIDPDNDEAFVDPDKESYWMPVDLYVGGAEHAVLHLLYSRFWHKVLYDAGFVSTKEPFQKLFNQGMILAFSYQDERGKYYHPDEIESRDDGHFVKGKDIEVDEQVEKMSKSKLNVANPDEVVDEFGADALRLYEMYMGPLDATKPWQTEGVKGMYRFLSRAYRLFTNKEGELSELVVDEDPSKDIRKLAHETTKRVTEDIEELRLNTAISALIEMLNALYKEDSISRQVAERFVLLLAPFAPHLAEEIWNKLGYSETLAYADWPEWKEEYLVDETVTLAIQVNGKMRGTVDVSADVDESGALAAAKEIENVASHLEGKDIVREIYVPGKIVNFIAK